VIIREIALMHIIFYLFTGIAFCATAETQDRPRIEMTEINITDSPNVEENEGSSCVMLSALKDRIVKSNNRSLGTLFGCVAGGIMGIVLVTTEYQASFPLFGNPHSIFYQICGVLLSAGVGGNLSSYIGASIDIITGEKTIFDLIQYLSSLCCKKTPEDRSLPIREPIEHRHFPFITSSESMMEERVTHLRQHLSGRGLTDEEIIEKLQPILSYTEGLLRENAELKAHIDREH
jgi:hypothetical protein